MSAKVIRAEERLRAQATALEIHEQRLRAEVTVLSQKIAEDQTNAFLRLSQDRWESQQTMSTQTHEMRMKEVENFFMPLQQELEKLQQHHNNIEKERIGAYEGLRRHLKELAEKTDNLATRTTALSTALTTSSQTRGNWGEVKLKRLFELAGLTQHIDFFEQATLEDGLRPDVVVRLPDRGVIPIDSKAIGEAYLQAVELSASPEQDALLLKHAKAMKSRISELSVKGYQESIEGEFDHVVMFIPSEGMAAAAFAVDPGLMDYAMSKSVLIATPVTMLGLLRTIQLYWQQHELALGAKEIYETSREFYKRVTTMIEHFQKVGTNLSKASASFNDAMNSYQMRVLPQGRRLEELRVSDTLQTALPEAIEIENQIRS